MIRANLREYFRPIAGPGLQGLRRVVRRRRRRSPPAGTRSTPSLRLPNCRARAYLVQDHEPEFFATSAESVFAERTYALGPALHRRRARGCATSSRAATARAASAFQLGVDHDVYRPRPVERRRDTVIFYARARHAAARRAARRAGARGAAARGARTSGSCSSATTSPSRRAVRLRAPRRRDARASWPWAYSEATVGLSLSLTNYSLIPQEMLACGLPCVELAGRALESVYGAGRPDRARERRPGGARGRARAAARRQGAVGAPLPGGIAFVSSMTWDRAADEVEGGLRDALRARAEGAAPASGAIETPSRIRGQEEAAGGRGRASHTHEVTRALLRPARPGGSGGRRSRARGFGAGSLGPSPRRSAGSSR